MSLNKVMLIGNAGKDPDVRHLESGVVRANFTLATSEKYKDRTTGETKEQTEWHNIVCWRSLAEIVERFVRKGTQVYIEGKITTRQYTDQTGTVRYITEIVADSMQLLGRRSDNESPYHPAANAYQPQARPAYGPGAPSYGQQQYQGGQQGARSYQQSAPSYAQSAPQPAPVQSAPVQPAPVQSAPVQPAPAQPMPSEPESFQSPQEEDDLPF